MDETCAGLIWEEAVVEAVAVDTADSGEKEATAMPLPRFLLNVIGVKLSCLELALATLAVDTRFDLLLARLQLLELPELFVLLAASDSEELPSLLDWSLLDWSLSGSASGCSVPAVVSFVTSI